MKRALVIAVLASVLMTSCLVSKKTLSMEQAKSEQLSKENEELQKKLDDQTKVNVDEDAENKALKDAKAQLEKDTADCKTAVRALQKKYKDLNNLYDETSNRSRRELASTTSQKEKLAQELDKKQHQLDDKEKALNELNVRLAEREKRVNELQDLLSKKDQALNDLKKRIETALLGFNKDELSVTVKDGKIYVSLAEKLLFKSGSTAVDVKGRLAINKLAAVLEKQADFDILIEGHTDNVPIKGGTIKDNWDLSVLRSTSIVRILTIDNKVDPNRVIPSGRGENLPLGDNKTKEGRAQNRRTDIILSPNLDAVFKILNTPEGNTK